MAFCNGCGGSIESGAKFCPKCGAAVAPGAPATAASIPPAAPAKSSSALKIVLIVVAAVVVIGILGLGTFAIVIHHIVSRSHVETNGDGNVKVDTPFGTVESTKDPSQAARDAGVELYPGATVVKNGSATFTFGSVHTAAAQFESDDSVAAVAEFYKSKFPGANVSSAGDRVSIVAGQKGNMTTISIEPQDGKTRIHVAKVTTQAGGSSD